MKIDLKRVIIKYMSESEAGFVPNESGLIVPEKVIHASPKDIVKKVESREMSLPDLEKYLEEIARRERILQEEKKDLQKLVFQDVLVEHSMNRRGYNFMMDKAFNRSLAEKKPISELNFDGDLFKRVNDAYGHHGGDKLIQLIDFAMAKATREEDILGRLGGDEFRIGLPETDEAGAIEVALRVQEIYLQLQRDIIAGKDIANPELQEDFPPITVDNLQTLSIGIATSGPQNGIFTLKDLGKCSDVALYRSKHIKHLEDRLGELGYIPINERSGKVSAYREHKEPQTVNPHRVVVGPIDVIPGIAA